MGMFFQDDLLDEFGTSALGYTSAGGLTLGDVRAIAAVARDADASRFYDAWVAYGDRLAAEASQHQREGRIETARELFLKSANCYAPAYHPLYGRPVDPRLPAAFAKQIRSFEAGLALAGHPCKKIGIPFEGATLPAYLLRAAGRELETRPLVILTNGYDATVMEMYFAGALAAAQRGYHCLFFDGPGQGAPLIEQGIHIRPDWETVVRAVVDVAQTLPGVDAKQIALSGWSLGGYLSLRAATGEHRLAACIADPGLWGPLALFSGAAANPQAAAEKMQQMAANDPRLRWSLFARGYFVHGVDTAVALLEALQGFTLDGLVENIACPTLLTAAENDDLGKTAPRVYEALTCRKTLLKFSAAEGAGDHCELYNRPLLNARVFDWLDSVFAR